MAEQEQMGQLVLVVGDFHVPNRCSEVPAKYKQMITPNKVGAVLCTGNMGCRQIHDWIKSLSSAFHVVKGDYQEESFTELPSEKVVDVFGVKIGLIHGHQIIPWGDDEALSNKAKQLGVNILISGHSHELRYSQYNNINLINPGSMTGAYSSLKIDAVASFMILQIKSTEIVVYSYYLSEGELKCVDSKFDRAIQ